VTCPGFTPSGTMDFLEGSNLLGTVPVTNGIATLTKSFTAAGSPHTLQAQYSGDTNCTPGLSNTFPLTVIRAGTTTTHTSSPNPPTAGAPVTLPATVTVNSPGSGTPTGTVSFFDQSNNGQNLGTAPLGPTANHPGLAPNQAALDVSSRSAGTHN